MAAMTAARAAEDARERNETKGNKNNKKKNTCAFFLKKKNRQCNFEAKPGSAFCYHHDPETQRARVPCPCCSTSVFDIQKHLPFCPKAVQVKKRESEPYFVRDVNLGSQESGTFDTSTSQRKAEVLGMDRDTLLGLVERIHKAVNHLRVGLVYDECEVLRPKECLFWLGDQGKREFHRTARKYDLKHIIQQASIIGHLNKFGLHCKNVPVDEKDGKEGKEGRGLSCVELGAGKGHLGVMVAESKNINHLVLVDRGCFNLKADKVLRAKESTTRVQRIVCDLKDFRIENLKELEERRVLVVGKHLCGGATDLALNLSMNDKTKGALDMYGLCIATCCHHRCTWQAYVGKKQLQALGFTPQEFQLISWMTGWANCGHDVAAASTSGEPQSEEMEVKVSGMFPMFSRDERIDAGLACKRLIDLGRLSWLKEKGLDVDYKKYAPLDITGENLLLLAK